MLVADKFSLVSNLNNYKGWQNSDKPKYASRKAIVHSPEGDLPVKLLKLERINVTFGKICLAILATLGTLFFGLFNKNIRNLWTGIEVKKIALYEKEPEALVKEQPEDLKKAEETELVKEKIEELKKVENAARAIMQSGGGFRYDTGDFKYGERKNTTFSECHGNKALCKTTIPFSLEVPSALDQVHLKKYAHENSSLYYSLLFKHLAHAFSLIGKLNIPGTLNLEGFNETFSIPLLFSSLTKFAKEHLTDKEFSWLKFSIQNAVWHQNLTREKIKVIHELIQNNKNEFPILIGAGYDWHSNQVIIYKDSFILCEKQISKILIFKIIDKEKITENFLYELADRTNTTKKTCHTTKIRSENNSLNEFGIKFEKSIKVKEPDAGNCSYANFKLAIFALLSLHMKKRSDFSWDECFAITKPKYKAFSLFDRELILIEFIKEFENPSIPEYKNSINAVAKILKEKIQKLPLEKRLLLSPHLVRGGIS